MTINDLDKTLQECLRFKLKDEKMWNEFYRVGNEMIITKNGRCLFPLLLIHAFIAGDTDLDLDELFYISIVLQPLDNMRWKFVSGKWRPIGGYDEPVINEKSERFYKSVQAIGSPMSLKNILAKEISFAKLKLSNCSNKLQEPNHLILSSFRCYQPSIILQRVTGEKRKCNQIAGRWIIKEAQFIAVTHYQNPKICDMKKSFNPHAKGFLNLSSELSNENSSDTDERDSFENVVLDGRDYTAVFLLNSLANKLAKG